MGQTGNFNGILNVLSALKQEDEDIYDICLSYPNTFSPQEIVYQPMVQTESKSKKDTNKIPKINTNNRPRIQVHNNPDVKVLWNISGDIDMTRDICSCIIDCEVVGNDEKWKNKLIKLKEYIDDNNKLPSQTDNNKQIQLLNCWLSHQKHNYDIDILKCKYNTQHPEIHELWTEFINDPKYKEYLCIDRIDNWKNKLIKLKEYIDDNSKSPSQLDNDNENKSLGGWISTQKMNYNQDISKCKECMKIEEIHQLWTEFINDPKYKEYFIDNIETWKNKLIIVKEYIDNNNKRPSCSDKKHCVQILGKWIILQTKNYDLHISLSKHSMKTPEIHELWTEFINDPKYKEYLCGTIEIWKNKLILVKEYIDDNNKTPSNLDKNQDIKMIGTWVSTQKTNYNQDISKCKDNMKSLEIHQLWTEFINDPKYKKYFIDYNGIWKNKLITVKEYIDDNNKTPSTEDKNKEIKSLGKWFSTQKSNYNADITLCKEGMKCQEIHQLWTKFINDTKYKKYFIDYNETWKHNLLKLKEYIDDNNKLPTNRVGNSDETNSLCNWNSTQKSKYNPEINLCETYMKIPEIHQMWTEFINDPKYKEYFIDNIEIWKNKLLLVKEYIDKNKKRPSSKDNDNEIKILGSWVVRQSKYYNPDITLCKHGMKTPEIHQMWTEFINDPKYREYFIPKPAKKSMKLNLIQQPSEPVVVEDIETRKQRFKSEISILHQKYKTMNSETLRKYFEENPEEWEKYHEISEKNEESFPDDEIPRNRVIAELEKIKTKRKKIVVDMGCGKGQISQHFINDQRFDFTNYDHVSGNTTVEVCDISKTPLEDNSVEIAILSLAMWGSNCESYITESYRILESGCKLYIIEPTKRKRWTDEGGKPADKLIKLLEENGFRIINSSIEKFCMFECIKL
jgi:ubiquinone/menaquinone biosynthesis C-methylase UbiE